MRALPLLLALVAAPALAERPADVLARLRGTPSTSSGALGSAFPQQYVDAYRHVPRPIFVFPGARPVVVTPPCVTRVACPAPGFPAVTTTVSTTTTDSSTTTVTTTTVTTSDGVAPAWGATIEAGATAPGAIGCRVLAPAPADRSRP